MATKRVLTQFDTQVRIMTLRNLDALCKRYSGMSHRYWIETTKPTWLVLGYSNPNEYGYEAHIYASFPLVACFGTTGVLFDSACLVRAWGGRKDDADYLYEAFMDLLIAEPLWFNPRDKSWKTEAEIKATEGMST